MANYVGSCRSNYFRVKDEDAFRQWAEKREIGVEEDEADGRKYFFIYPLIMEEQGFYPVDNAEWPHCFSFADEPDFCFTSELSKHLADGSARLVAKI